MAKNEQEATGFTVDRCHGDFDNNKIIPKDDSLDNPKQVLTMGVTLAKRTKEEEAKAGARIKL